MSLRALLCNYNKLILLYFLVFPCIINANIKDESQKESNNKVISENCPDYNFNHFLIGGGLHACLPEYLSCRVPVVGETSLMAVSFTLDLDKVRLCIANGWRVNDKDEYKRTALSYAVINSNIKRAEDVVKYLLENGADVNNVDASGTTILISVARSSPCWENPPPSVLVLKALIAHQVDVNKPGECGFTPLMAASMMCNIEMVEELLNAGAKTGVRDICGMSALMYGFESSCYRDRDKNKEKLVSMLLSFGSNPYDAGLPCYHACDYGSKCVQYLPVCYEGKDNLIESYRKSWKPKITMQRIHEDRLTTLSEFIATSPGGEKVVGYMLEPSGPGNLTKNSHKRIPAGTYDVSPCYNCTRWPDGYQITNKNLPEGHRDILIHPGNTCCNTEGCLLPGKSYSHGILKGGKCKYESYYVTDSRDEFASLHALIGRGNAILVIVDINQCFPTDSITKMNQCPKEEDTLA